MTGKMSKTDIMLLAYATGSLGRYKHLIVIIILIFNPRARKRVAFFEEIGGDLISQSEPVEVSSESLEIILRKIEKSKD